jgi:hypothetical protein
MMNRGVRVKDVIEIFGRQLDLPDGMVEYLNPLRAGKFLEKFLDLLVISGPYGFFVDELLLFADLSHKFETSGVKRDRVLFSTDIVDDHVDRLCGEIGLWKPIRRRAVSEVVWRLPTRC